MQESRDYFSPVLFLKCHTALKNGSIEVDILQLPAIGTLSSGIDSGRMCSGVQTGLTNQGKDDNSAVYPQEGKQIIVHYDFLYFLKSFFFLVTHTARMWFPLTTLVLFPTTHIGIRILCYVLSVLRIKLSDELMCHQDAVDLR